jgi:cytochrome c553
MKRVLFLIAVVVGLAPLMLSKPNPPPAAAGPQAAATPLKMPTTLTLGTEAKLGAVTFNHAEHAATGKRNIAGTGPIACVECHHTAQPAEEVAKTPPLKTAWPADRKTTLTAELVEKDPAAVGIIACRNCHARAGMKPAVWPEIPTIKHESSAATLTLTNQLAFHRNCASCHDEVVKQRPDAKAPRTMQCTACHKKA